MVLAKKLRDAVLQAAIQGQLTKREKDDTPIQDTLLQIKNKRKTLNIDKKLFNSKKINPEEIPFKIPENWSWVRLGNVCEVITKGSSPKWQGVNYVDKGLLFITSENVGVEKLLFSSSKYVEEKFDDISPRSSLKKGDLLTNIVGASIGRTAMYNSTIKANINQAVCVIRLVELNLGLYIMKYMNSNTAYKIMMSDKVETARPNISLTNISDFLIPFPPIEEQQRIVDRVNELMEKIDEYEKVEKELIAIEQKFPDDMRNALLQAAMQGKLTEQLDSDSSVDEMLEAIKEEKKKLIKDKKIKKEKSLLPIDEDDIPFDIPGNWRWERFANIAILNPRNSLDDTLEVSFIPMTLIRDGYNNEHTAENRIWKDVKRGFTHIKEGDLGFAKITPCFQNRKSVIFKNLINGYAAGTTELHIIRTIPNSLLAEYLLWFVKSPYFIEGGVNTYTGTAGQQRIHKDYLPNCLVPVPPDEEQQRIVEKLEKLLPLCETL